MRMKFGTLATACLFLAPAAATAAILHLASTPQTIHRGVISPDIAPVLHIKSGDTVKIDTISHGGLTSDPVAYFAKAGIAAKDPHGQVVGDRVGTQRECLAWSGPEAFGEGAADVLAPFGRAGEFGDRLQRLGSLFWYRREEGQAGRGEPVEGPDSGT